MAVRWKLDPRPTGLRAIGAGPRGSFLHDGGDWILRVEPLGGNYARPLRGWFWYGMDQNTCNKPCATAAEAKAEAMAFYKKSLLVSLA